MNRILKQTFIITFIVIISLAASACKDIFYSKEKIDYMHLIIGEDRIGSIESDKNYYFIFEADQEVKYSITVTCEADDKYYNDSLYVKVVVFCYDTEDVLLNEAVGSLKKEAVGSFYAPRSGKIVIRIKTNRSMKSTINVKLM